MTLHPSGANLWIMRWLFRLHLYVGLIAAVFLAIAGLTGSILVFAADYDRWLHPSLWHVTPAGPPMSEQRLIDNVRRLLEARSSTAPIAQINLGDERSAQLFLLEDGAQLFVDPYRGLILGVRDQPPALDNILTAVQQLHVRLMAGDRGEQLVDLGTAAMLLLTPTGLCLWFRKKRITVRCGASPRRMLRDLHHVSGLYASAFVLLLAASGLLLGMETRLFSMVHARAWRPVTIPHSIEPRAGVNPPTIDQLLARADRALPSARTVRILLPRLSTSPMRVVKQAGSFGESTVYLDRFTGSVLRVDDFRSLPPAYRLHVFVRALHTGAIGGTAGKIAIYLSSLALVLLVITGTTIWWQRFMR